MTQVSRVRCPQYSISSMPRADARIADGAALSSSLVHLNSDSPTAPLCRCGEAIAKDSLRTAEAVENADGFFSTHYRHWGCSSASLGVNTPGFHDLEYALHTSFRTFQECSEASFKLTAPKTRNALQRRSKPASFPRQTLQNL